MSRSRKKTPFYGYVAFGWGARDSEKEDKRICHRRMRAAILIRLHNADPDEVLLPHEREVSNVWCMTKDGKRHFDPLKYPEWMRK